MFSSKMAKILSDTLHWVAVRYLTVGVLAERSPGFVFDCFLLQNFLLTAGRGRSSEAPQLGLRDAAAQQQDEWSMLTSGRREKVTCRFTLEGLDSSLSHLTCFFISHLDQRASVVA